MEINDLLIRKIQSLYDLGWNANEIARELSYKTQSISKILNSFWEIETTPLDYDLITVYDQVADTYRVINVK